MTDLNVITSLPTVAILALVLRGLAPFWTRHAGKEELCHFARGLGWIIGVFLLRIFYWGAARGVVLQIDPALWRAWSGLVSGADWINGLFNIGLCVGAWHVLLAFHAMIPEPERRKWSVLASPFYPQGWCFARLVRRYLGNWRTRKD